MKKIVVKVGTSTITDGNFCLSKHALNSIAKDITCALKQSVHIVLVSSGAITAGREVLKNKSIEHTLSEKQMLSCVGQLHLMESWNRAFCNFNISTGQLLLTRRDISNRKGYLNARNTIETLLKRNIVPIINENDAVATSEIVFGDNDNLAALVSNLIGADLLILLTDQKGLFTKNPDTQKDAQLIEEINEIDDKIFSFAKGTNKKQSLGTGGMLTKIQAAKLATSSGTQTIITSSSTPFIISNLIKGEKHGTVINAKTTQQESKKRWLLSKITQGFVCIDQGAHTYLKTHGSSLLFVGISSFKKSFERGSVVDVFTKDNKLIGKGIANYSSHELDQLLKAKPSDVTKILGYSYGSEFIHRDNLALI